MKVEMRVWRQDGPDAPGKFESYPVDVVEGMSFLEALDVVNESLVESNKEPIVFEHDCREGICGSCGAMVNGRAHGPGDRSTLCQVHMRQFKDGDVIYVEPWRAGAFPVIKDLMVDRSSFDRIIQAGGYISVRTGSAPDGNALPSGKAVSDEAMSAAECIGCGACAAACPNASASLFTAAKISHLSLLPQGDPERSRATDMVREMDAEGFGSCTNHGECSSVCPKGIDMRYIGRMNRELLRQLLYPSKGQLA
jgi:succinate dehydrogenase / fumarate reductase iron-sulfur subunit